MQSANGKGDSSDCSSCEDGSDSECDSDRNYDEKVSKTQNVKKEGEAKPKLLLGAPPVFRPNNMRALGNVFSLGMSARPYGASRPPYPQYWERPDMEANTMDQLCREIQQCYHILIVFSQCIHHHFSHLVFSIKASTTV
ncbi:unnamed protein product [Dovyalis caffra]|uniref:Uncharacterized protein n=1 Tax=Dovyalis caffra TaxID=77055 RepID=A0AAV1R6B1_9ROSI|nr:unnamed protein product [Dovyalis caffra]